MLLLYYAGHAGLDAVLILGAMCDKCPHKGVLQGLGFESESRERAYNRDVRGMFRHF